MILHLSSDYRERNLILFGFLFNVSRFHPSICFEDCDVCYLFYRENLASSYKCRKVELIFRACVRRKRFVPVRNSTWMVLGHLKHKDICLVLM